MDQDVLPCNQLIRKCTITGGTLLGTAGQRCNDGDKTNEGKKAQVTNMNSETLTSPQAVIAALYVFALAAFLGYQVISRVPPLLHTPLMSATNAISGISYAGFCLKQKGRASPPDGSVLADLSSVHPPLAI